MVVTKPILERRPAVQLATFEAATSVLQAILWGIEEEGIPSEICDLAAGSATVMAHQAAHMSSLNVGVGVTDAEVVLHHRDLPGDKPLFVLSGRDRSAEALKTLGKNAARLVKCDPLLFDDDRSTKAPPTEPSVAPAQSASDDLERIVGAVMDLLARQRMGK
jgi:hypothetical protein